MLVMTLLLVVNPARWLAMPTTMLDTWVSPMTLPLNAALNAHVHLHLCMLDGVVVLGRQGLAFRGAQVDEACVERVQALTWCGVRNL